MRRRLTSHRCPWRTDDIGAGLPELLVAMALFTVLAGAIGAVFVSTMGSVRSTTTTNATTADARLAMEAMTRTLRVAVRPLGQPSALVEAQANRVVVYASLQRSATQSTVLPTRVTYAHDAATGCLNETQVPANALPAGANPETVPPTWTTGGTTRCLVRTSVAPTFAYYDNGALQRADGTAVPALALPASGLSPSALPSVVSVQVAVTAQAPGASDVAGVVARDRVSLSNVLVERSPTGGG